MVDSFCTHFVFPFLEILPDDGLKSNVKKSKATCTCTLCVGGIQFLLWNHYSITINANAPELRYVSVGNDDAVLGRE